MIGPHYIKIYTQITQHKHKVFFLKINTNPPYTLISAYLSPIAFSLSFSGLKRQYTCTLPPPPCPPEAYIYYSTPLMFLLSM